MRFVVRAAPSSVISDWVAGSRGGTEGVSLAVTAMVCERLRWIEASCPGSPSPEDRLPSSSTPANGRRHFDDAPLPVGRQQSDLNAEAQRGR